MSEIAAYLGVHRTTVSEWWRQYQQQGDVALRQQKRGNKLGEGRTLNQSEEALIQRLMREHFPDELKIDSALWTRSGVQALIASECGVEMPSAHGGRVPEAVGLQSAVIRSNAPMSRSRKRSKRG